jgi:hypothetical protein
MKRLYLVNEVAYLVGEVLKICLDKRAPAICTVRSHATLKKFTETFGFVNGLLVCKQVVTSHKLATCAKGTRNTHGDSNVSPAEWEKLPHVDTDVTEVT